MLHLEIHISGPEFYNYIFVIKLLFYVKRPDLCIIYIGTGFLQLSICKKTFLLHKGEGTFYYIWGLYFYKYMFVKMQPSFVKRQLFHGSVFYATYR